MIADRVVTKLDKVRQSAKDEWVACCPAHDDKSPSLTVRETEDGRLLLHCFAGCSIESILTALGIGFGDLFSDPLAHNLPMLRHPFSPGAVLRALRRELLIVAIAGRDAMDGKLTDADRVRMMTAIERIEEGVRYA